MGQHPALATFLDLLPGPTLDALAPVPNSVAVATQVDLRAAIYLEAWNEAVRAAARACEACGGHHDTTDERAVGRHEGYDLAEQAVRALLRSGPTREVET